MTLPMFCLGSAFLCFSLLFVPILLYAAKKTGWLNIYYVAIAAGLIFALLGLGAMTSVSYYRFSRADGQLTTTRRLFGIDTGAERIPLSDLDHAEIETSKNTRRIVILRHSGTLLFLTSSTDREGYYEFRDAINAFLGHSSVH